MHLLFPGNILAHSRMSWRDPQKKRCIAVAGSKKMVIYDDVEAGWRSLKQGGVRAPVVNGLLGGELRA